MSYQLLNITFTKINESRDIGVISRENRRNIANDSRE